MTVRERVVLNCEEFRDREQDYKSHQTNHIGLVRGKVLGYPDRTSERPPNTLSTSSEESQTGLNHWSVGDTIG